MSQNQGVNKELQVENPTAPVAEKEIWTCARVVDERKQIICGEQAVDEVLVRNDAGLFCVPLCEFHKYEHYEFYRRRRIARAQNKMQHNSAGPFRVKGAPFRENDPFGGEAHSRNGRALASARDAAH